MTLVLHLRIVGTLLLLLAAINVALPRHFRWNEELQHVSPLTRQVFRVHCGFIILVLGMMGLLSAAFTDALLESTRLGRAVLAGLALFWGVRLYTQWFVYDRRLWWGRRFETGVHLVFTLLWSYFAGVYACAWWSVPS